MRDADTDTYIDDPPPALSRRAGWLADRIEREGWRPNRRLRALSERRLCAVLGVYVWEWRYVLTPLMEAPVPATDAHVEAINPHELQCT